MDRLSSDSSRETHTEPKGMVSSASVATIQATESQHRRGDFLAGDAAENNAPESSQNKDDGPSTNEDSYQNMTNFESGNSADSANFEPLSSNLSADGESKTSSSEPSADYSGPTYSMHPSDYTSQSTAPTTSSTDTTNDVSAQEVASSSSGPKYGSSASNNSRYSTGSSILLPPPRISNLGSDPLSITARRQHQRNLSINSTNSPVRASVISHFSQYSPVVEEVDRVQVGTAQVRQMSSNESAALSTTTAGNSSSSSSTTPSATVRTISINRARASVRELEGMLTEIQALRRSISDHNKDRSQVAHQQPEDLKRQSGSAFPIESISEDTQSDEAHDSYPVNVPVTPPPAVPENSHVTTALPGAASSSATVQAPISRAPGKIPTVTDMSPGIHSQIGVTQTQSRSSSGGSSGSKPPSRASSRNSSKPLPRLPTEEQGAASSRKSMDNGKPERSSSIKRKLFPWIGLRKASPSVTQDASETMSDSSKQLTSSMSASSGRKSSEVKIPPTPPLATSQKSRYGAHNRQISMDSQWSSGTTFESSTDDIEELKTSIDSYRASMNASNGSEGSLKVNKRMSAPPLNSTESYRVSPTAKHEEIPKLPELSHTWSSNMSLEQEMDDMLQPPPILPMSKSRHDSTQESSAESFQTAASYVSDEEVSTREAADTMPRSDSQRTQLNTRSPGQSSGTNTVTLQRDSFGILNNNMQRQSSLKRNVSVTTTKGSKSREVEGAYAEVLAAKDIDAERRESSGTAKTSKGRGSIPSVGPVSSGPGSRNLPFAVPAKSPNRRSYHRQSDSLPGHISSNNDATHPRDQRDALQDMSTWQREHKSSKKHHRNKSHAGNFQGPSVPSGGRPLSGSYRSVSMPSQVPKSASGTSRENSGLRRSRKAFSQANIEKLMSLADSSFQLDEIDLPPDEKHLLEKFVDALSKLSVEINLDDGKRLEGKRRLHNALRAIEGWI